MLRLSTKSLRISRSTLSSLKFASRTGARHEVNALCDFRSFSSEVDSKNKEEPKPKTGLWNKYFGLESNVASPDFKSRWLMVAPAFATHMAIGSPWAWSVIADAITREKGFVVPAFGDWSLMEAAYPLSLVFLVLGVSASVVGKWQMKVGARHAMAMAAVAFGGGSLVGAAGIYMHSLPLVYAGYGVLGGLGLGLSYTPPVQTLMQWFPDKKGVASGLTIAGFGSGALVFTPAAQYLMKKFAKMPEYLGPADQFVTKIQDGRIFAEVNGAMVEVVQAGAAELAKIPYALSEGLYVVGSGSSGAVETLAITGAAYFGIILASAMAFKKPHPSYVAPVAVVDTNSKKFVAPVPAREITLDEAMRQPQFYLLGTSFFCLAAGGMGMFSVAKPMMSEVFSAALPTVVNSAFGAKFILMLSAGNLGGRLIWAAVSDAIGRKKTLMIFTAGSIPLYFCLPTLVDSVVTTGSAMPMYAFCASSALAISMMGGVYAILPAYEADLFGTKFAGAVHGRMLLFSSLAALSGLPLLVKLRAAAEKVAVTDLVALISPEKFQAAFGAPIENALDLLATKTLTISKLMVLAPPGTLDPSPHLYDTTMYTLSGMMAVAFVAHSMVKPVSALPISAMPGAANAVDVSKIIDVAAPAVASADAPAAVKKDEVVGDRLVK